MMSDKLNRAVLAGLAATGAGMFGTCHVASAQVVIGTWEELVTPPPPDPDPLPPNFHRPIGSAGTEGWVDWSNRGVYTRDTYGATHGSHSLKLLTADDGGNRWMQSLTIPLHGTGYVDDFLTSGQFAIDVSWRESDFAQGGTWSQVENLYVNAPAPHGFAGRGRATTDSHNAPPWNGSWDPTNFDDNTRTLTWDMQELIDGNPANGEITTVPASNGGGWLELILATNYDGAANPATAAFYFDNARLLPRVVTSEWKGGAPDPDNEPSNGNAAENFWYASQNWTMGVPGVADSVAVFGTNGGALVGPQTVNTDRLVTLGGMTFDNVAGYTIGGTGSIAMQASAGAASINVNAGNHTVNVPVALTSPTNVSVAGSNVLSVKRFTGAGLNLQQGTVRIIPDGTAAGTSKVAALTIAGGATPSAKLDISDNAFIIDYTGASPIADVKAQVASGYAGGAWTGNGIVSSEANNSTHGVGYAESSALFSSFPATFGGESVDDTSLLLRLARYGDANLDGTVNLQDFNRLASAFGSSNAVWSQGDFNYDGAVNLQDFNRLAANFGLSAAGPDVTPQDWAALGAAVPEPGSAGLLLLSAVAALGARRRRPR